AHSWPNSAERARALASFLRYYNRRRPHSSLGDRPPISRVHNVRG
ncbi:MAG TPA: integrase core domain-containing protein, partial [Solirubrobacterales bacterium]